MSKKKKYSSHRGGIYKLWGIIISLIVFISISIPIVRYLQREGNSYIQKKVEKSYRDYNHIPRVKRYTTKNSVAILIDDIGWERNRAEEFLKIDAPISFSILPHLPLSETIAEEINRFDRDILLHLPMEPHGYPHTDPGIGAIMSNMRVEDLEYELTKDINSVPYIIGINNHMGSKVTEDKNIMRIILKMLQKRDLFFLDSITSSNTVAFKVARDMGIKSAQRKLFLDNIQEIDYIKRQIMRLGEIAKRDGSAIGIGHPHKVTAAALREMIPELRKEGIDIIPISRMVD
ncbi:MAG: divergent polysaccharide deacetylase family protein [Nitrospinae bacterium]|nr:divergent polysaccharide deacetylase family protein [Nitrospinota bacterium]